MVEPSEHDGRSLACWRYAKMWWERGRRLGYFLGTGPELRDVMLWVREGRVGRLTGAQAAFLLTEERSAAMRCGESVAEYRTRAVHARMLSAKRVAATFVQPSTVPTAVSSPRLEAGHAVPMVVAHPVLAVRSSVGSARPETAAVLPMPVEATLWPHSPSLRTPQPAGTQTTRGQVGVPPVPAATLPPPPSVDFSHPTVRTAPALHLTSPTRPASMRVEGAPRIAVPAPPVTAPHAADLNPPTLGRSTQHGAHLSAPRVVEAAGSSTGVSLPVPMATQGDSAEVDIAPPIAVSKWARPTPPPIEAAAVLTNTEEPRAIAHPRLMPLAIESVEVWVPPAPAARLASAAPMSAQAPTAQAARPPTLATPVIAATHAVTAVAIESRIDTIEVVPQAVIAAGVGEAEQSTPHVLATGRVEHAVVPMGVVDMPEEVGVVRPPVPVLDTLEIVRSEGQTPAGITIPTALAGDHTEIPTLRPVHQMTGARAESPTLGAAALVGGVRAVGPVVATFNEPPIRTAGNGWRPIQKRVRRLVARWTLSHRDGQAGALKWPRIATEVVSSLALVAAGYWSYGSLNPAQAHPEVAVAESPAPAPPPETFSPVPDWADSIPNPDEVWGLQRGGRSYAPVGGGGPAPRSREPSWATEGDPVRAVPPVLVRRVSGSSLMLYALTGDSLPLRGGRWSLPGLCQQVLTVQGVADAWSASARDDGAQSGWLYGLAVPSGQCGSASAQVIARVQPTTFEREALLRGLVNARGDLLGAELQDVAFGRIDGARHAWGVFRIDGERITMIPTPPPHYVGFVATESARKWTFQWLRSLEGERVQMALAGVFDTDNDGFPEAVFGQRDVGGGAEVAVVGQTRGTWSVRLTRALEATP